MNIGLLPLDTRPCNISFPKKIAAIAGVNLHVLPYAYAGYFLEVGNKDKICEWLELTVRDLDVLILSVDMLCYGGLIQSRKMDKSTKECLGILDVIERLKEKNKSLQIFAYNVIMRTSITTVDAESRKYWEYINLYSQAYDKVQRYSNEKDIQDLEYYKSLIPANILSEYWETRKRNHEVNKKSLELVKKGVIDYLLLLQEDSAPYGMQVYEQQRLREIINRDKLDGYVQIQNGTDEGGIELVARAINKKLYLRPRVFVYSLIDDMDKFIALYEDMTVAYNIQHHIRAIGGIQVDKVEEADFILAVHMMERQQQDVCIGRDRSLEDHKLIEKFVTDVSCYIAQGYRVGVLDIAYANGADELLIHTIMKAFEINDLAAYAGWNTASNSLGTVLSQLAVCSIDSTPNARERNLEFTLERICDDYSYQAYVRCKVNPTLQEQGINVCNLTESKAVVEEEIKQMMDVEIQRLIKNTSIQDKVKWHIELPWPRTFEVSVDIEVEMEGKDEKAL